MTSIPVSVLKKDRRVQMEPYSEREIVQYFEDVLDFTVEKENILQIGDILGYNPQAISVCAKYMNEECCDSDAPMEDVKLNLARLINELEDEDRDISVKKMYERSLNKVKEKGADVWNLLCKISILNPNGVSKELVRDVLLGPESSSSLGKCVGTIKRLGLVQGSEMYVMHRLMQAVIQVTMREDERMFKMVLEETIENLFNGWDNEFEYLIDKWPIFNEIGENVEYLWKYVDETIDIDKKGMLLSVNSEYLENIGEVKGDLVTMISKFQDLVPRHEPEMLDKYKVSYGIIKGYDLGWNGKNDEAMEYYKSMIASIDDQHHLDKGRLYYEFGEVYDGIYDFNGALDKYSKSLEQFKLHYGGSEVNHMVASVYNNIGVCYFGKGENDKAIGYFNKVLKIEQELQELLDGDCLYTPLVAMAHMNIGACYGNQGNIAKELEQYFASLGIFQSIFNGDNHSNIADIYMNIASIHYDQGNFVEAKDNYEKAYEIYKRLMSDEYAYTVDAFWNIQDCMNKI